MSDELERGDEPPTAKPLLSGWEWWPAWHKALCERNRLELMRMQAIERIIRKGIREPF